MSGHRYRLAELAGWASGLTYADLPERVIGWAKSQVLSQLAAVRAGLAHPTGAALTRAFGPPLGADAKQSAGALAALGSWLHYDDTAYAGHLSNSTVTVAVAYARQGGLDGRALITAVVAANECAARVTAASTLGRFQGQLATHTHLAGSVAARLHAESAPARRWVDAFGLAFAYPPQPIGPGFMGNSKVLNTFVPVRMGLDACDAAAAGLAGVADILEHEDGLLARCAIVPLPEELTAGLATRWHTETLSFKIRPSGPGGDAAVDCAAELHGLLPPGFDAADIAEVVVHSPWYTVLVDRRAQLELRRPEAPTAPLVLSIPYPVATALLTGGLAIDDFAAPAVRDGQRWALAARVRVEHDPDLTRACFTGTAPFGAALRRAGPRAVAWLRDYGRLGTGTDGQWFADLIGEPGQPEAGFADASRTIGARVVVKLADGRSLERARDIPVGAVGPDTRANHPALVRRKFRGTGGSAAVADGVLALEHASAAEVVRLVDAALAPSCSAPSCSAPFYEEGT